MILLGDDGDDHPKIPAILVGVIRAGDAKPPSEKVLRGGPSYDFFRRGAGDLVDEGMDVVKHSIVLGGDWKMWIKLSGFMVDSYNELVHGDYNGL